MSKLGNLGATEPGPGISDWQAMLFELILTVGLFSVISGTASAAQNVGAIAALGVGGYISLAGLWSAPVSGASMNPARSFGPAVASGVFEAQLLYWAAPITGGLIAALLYEFLFMRRGREPVDHGELKP